MNAAKGSSDDPTHLAVTKMLSELSQSIMKEAQAIQTTAQPSPSSITHPVVENRGFVMKQDIKPMTAPPPHSKPSLMHMPPPAAASLGKPSTPLGAQHPMAKANQVEDFIDRQAKQPRVGNQSGSSSESSEDEGAGGATYARLRDDKNSLKLRASRWNSHSDSSWPQGSESRRGGPDRGSAHANERPQRQSTNRDSPARGESRSDPALILLTYPTDLEVNKNDLFFYFKRFGWIAHIDVRDDFATVRFASPRETFAKTRFLPMISLRHRPVDLRVLSYGDVESDPRLNSRDSEGSYGQRYDSSRPSNDRDESRTRDRSVGAPHGNSRRDQENSDFYRPNGADRGRSPPPSYSRRESAGRGRSRSRSRSPGPRYSRRSPSASRESADVTLRRAARRQDGKIPYCEIVTFKSVHSRSRHVKAVFISALTRRLTLMGISNSLQNQLQPLLALAQNPGLLAALMGASQKSPGLGVQQPQQQQQQHYQQQAPLGSPNSTSGHGAQQPAMATNPLLSLLGNNAHLLAQQQPQVSAAPQMSLGGAGNPLLQSLMMMGMNNPAMLSNGAVPQSGIPPPAPPGPQLSPPISHSSNANALLSQLLAANQNQNGMSAAPPAVNPVVTAQPIASPHSEYMARYTSNGSSSGNGGGIQAYSSFTHPTSAAMAPTNPTYRQGETPENPRVSHPKTSLAYLHNSDRPTDDNGERHRR
ncbi:hypothetical protein BJ085DRAFT_32178 [Dimargaris cristalligena]|uniref:RRM domain-containing protein n=1 Tax=Dimargaris cristalligena TaxID=215637 RepID=A0A4P9ZZC9_9FUNG|nr:hypothetical protein BJ085DRAFT_32178 [Dimargaris cristalligena]|eukprot:RKP39057.1 hypothetical protein BJ085DRAFT_32178 [Dimargaris cristalligena]